MVEDRPLVKHVFFTPDGEYVRSETIDEEGRTGASALDIARWRV